MEHVSNGSDLLGVCSSLDESYLLTLRNQCIVSLVRYALYRVPDCMYERLMAFEGGDELWELTEGLAWGDARA